MKQADVKVGGTYRAKVSGAMVNVRVDAERKQTRYKGQTRTVFDCTNLRTGKKLIGWSAAKFRYEVKVNPTNVEEATGRVLDGEKGVKVEEVEQRPDPTPPQEASPLSSMTPTKPATNPLGSDRDAAIRSWSAGGMPSANGGPSLKDRITASKLAGALNPKPAAPAPPAPSGDGTVAGYRPTPEQEAILAVARQSGLTCLVVAAGAGTGKTSTLKMLEETLPGNGQYTAFNTSLVAESKAKFKRARCNTTHSLAFQAVGRKYAHRLGGPRVRSSDVAVALGIEALVLELPADVADTPPRKKTLSPSLLASMVNGAIKRFCQSADDEVQAEHIRRPAGVDYIVDGRTVYTNSDRVREYLLPFARAAWADLASPDGKLPFTHDCYVKVWQLGRGADAPVIYADYILLDEAQDSAPVLLDIIKRQNALIVLVGDDNQRIYEWRGAVNAIAAFPDAPRRLLSQSFRFGQGIADVANAILAGLDEPTDLEMKGLATIPSRVFLPGDPPAPAPDCVLCRTNAAAVATVLAAVAEGKHPHLIGGGAEVVKFVRAAQDLQRGRSTSHPELCCFENWTEVQAFVKEEDGEDLKTMVKLIDEFGADPILTALDGMPAEGLADLVVCTAHKSKGREWDTVRLAGDFPPASKMDDADRRLLYVAGTRARYNLDLSACPPFMEGVDKATGEPVEPVDVVWTAPRATAEQLAAFLAGQGGAKTPAAPVPAPAADGTATPNAQPTDRKPGNRTAPTGFTWAQHGGGWVIRGPKGATGRVTVTRKNGATSTETLGPVVRSYPEADLYRVGR